MIGKWNDGGMSNGSSLALREKGS